MTDEQKQKSDEPRDEGSQQSATPEEQPNLGFSRLSTSIQGLGGRPLFNTNLSTRIMGFARSSAEDLQEIKSREVFTGPVDQHEPLKPASDSQPGDRNRETLKTGDIISRDDIKEMLLTRREGKMGDKVVAYKGGFWLMETKDGAPIVRQEAQPASPDSPFGEENGLIRDGKKIGTFIEIGGITTITLSDIQVVLDREGIVRVTRGDTTVVLREPQTFSYRPINFGRR